jgi:hypothetical protein
VVELQKEEIKMVLVTAVIAFILILGGIIQLLGLI